MSWILGKTRRSVALAAISRREVEHAIIGSIQFVPYKHGTSGNRTVSAGRFAEVPRVDVCQAILCVISSFAFVP